MTDHNQMGLFDSQARTQIELLIREIDALEKEIEPKVQKINENKSKVDFLLKYLAISDNHQAETISPPKFKRKRSPLGLDDRTVGNVAVKVLDRYAEDMHYGTLLEKMRTEESFRVGGQNPKGNLLAHLANDKRIVRTGKGIYGLKKWREKMAEQSEGS